MKRTKATKLDIATLTADMQSLAHVAKKNLDTHRKKFLVLDEKIAAVDNSILSIENNLGLCHQAVCSVKGTLEGRTLELTAHLDQTESEHRERYSAIDTRFNTLIEGIQSTEERNGRNSDAVLCRIGMLEERIPQIEARATALEENIPPADIRMQKIEENIPQTDARVRTLEADIPRIDAHMTALEERIAPIETQVTMLGERIPQIEAQMKAIESKIGNIEKIQGTVNARIVSVMRMSMAMFGVLVVTLGVLGWIVFRH